MTTGDLLTALHERQIDVRVVDRSKLRVTNAAALTPELRDALWAHKTQLVRELTLPLFDYALALFGGVEVDEKGKPVNGRKKVQTGMETML